MSRRADALFDVKRTIRSLSTKQRSVFDQLCAGNDAYHHPRTLKVLVDKGLATELLQPDSRISFLMIKRYSVPIVVHMAWAELCSEELGGDSADRR